MTTNYDFHDEPDEDAPIGPPPDSMASVATPRVWPVFLTFVLAVVAVLVIQVVLAIILVIWQLANGARIERVAEELPELLTEPMIFCWLLLSSQLVIGMAGILPALLSREPTLSRLGLTTLSLPFWGYPIVMLGSGIPYAIGLAFYYALREVMDLDRTFEMFYKKITWPLAGPWVLFVALAPGFMEELFFRGYMQRRLLQRWSPWTAILVTSALFALFHLSPHTILFAFPLGIWFGFIAWRTNSVWLCVICHAFINASGSIMNIGTYLAGWPEVPPIAISLPVGILMAGCFVCSIWLLIRSQPTPTAVAETIPTEAPIAISGADQLKMTE
jgi:membrane protease YdiL (CAAX protease family)